MIFADIPTNIGLGVSAFCAVIALAVAITGWITINKSQKREVTITDRFVDQSTFDAHIAEQKADDIRIWQQMQDDRDDAKERRALLEAKLSGIESKVDGLNASVSLLNLNLFGKSK